ncbi:APC family permease [Aeromicrobium sp. UC242_57]|uniref:APC family permease n=1 Tax=Aeromicrobium sp. UC242_57 TaxID=3374624 RepID=UPI003788BE66
MIARAVITQGTHRLRPGAGPRRIHVYNQRSTGGCGRPWHRCASSRARRRFDRLHGGCRSCAARGCLCRHPARLRAGRQRRRTVVLHRGGRRPVRLRSRIHFDEPARAECGRVLLVCPGWPRKGARRWHSFPRAGVLRDLAHRSLRTAWCLGFCCLGPVSRTRRGWWASAFAFLVVISLLGYRDIEVSAKVLGVALVLEGLVVLVVNFAIIFQGGDAGISAEPLNPANVFDGAPGLGLMFAFFAFVGFEATAVFRSEAKDPERTIPRATYIAIALIGGLYAFTSFAMANGLGVGQAAELAGADPSNTMQGLASRYAGTLVEDAVILLLVTSLFACCLSFHNVITRYQYNLARGRVFPAFLAETHAVHRAPSRSSVVVTVGSALILGRSRSPGSTRSWRSTRGSPARPRSVSCCSCCSRAWQSSPSTSAAEEMIRCGTR